MTEYYLGMVGLGVMGANLARNLARHGFSVAGYDLDPARRDALAAFSGEGLIASFPDAAAFLRALARPRRIILLVPSGAVDSAIASLKPGLDRGDLLIDLGNSFFGDTERRSAELEAEGLLFMGSGISGGEKGALHGPSIMPGGSPEAYALIAPAFEAIAARVDGEPCVAHLGPRGAGHYVKMVHNGIEYGIMQAIVEAYDLLKRVAGAGPDELHAIYSAWNAADLSSYLVEITAAIFAHRDPESGEHLVELILDEAQQKGTGKWTSQNALDIGVPVPTINAALQGRIISSLKEERVFAATQLPSPQQKYEGDPAELIDAVENALYASKVTSYAQGLAMLRMASQEYNYDLNIRDIAKIWRAGCIIRASLLGDIMDAYERDPQLINLMLDEVFKNAILDRLDDWRKVVQIAVGLGISVPAMSGALSYFDAYRSEHLPANLIQAQRDYFGAHTYRRIDKDGVFHTQWV